MSASRLRRHVLGWTAFLILYAIVYSVVSFFGMRNYAGILQDLIPIALAIPVASLAAAFNRRNSYLQALRDLWGRLVPAAQEAIQYTYISKPSETDFARTRVALSSAIDELRGVFKNVPARNASKGLYPYENLKDIQRIIWWLHNQDPTEETRLNARTCIIRLWQEMHEAMLREFDRDVPVEPIGKYLYWGKSVGDLLQNKTLAKDDLTMHRKASNPIQRPEPPLADERQQDTP